MKGVIFGTVIAFILSVGMSMAHAGEFKIYPNAKLDEKLTKESAEMAAKSNVRTKPSIYVTKDPFDKVLAFYKETGKEYTMPYQKPGKVQRLPSGRVLKTAFLIFDGAKDLSTSKLWAKIQRPYIGSGMEEGPDMTYIILLEKN